VDALQPHSRLTAVGGSDHDGGPGQRANAAVDTLGTYRRSIGRRNVSRIYHLYHQLIGARPLEADQGHHSSLLQRWNAGDGTEVSVENGPFVTLEHHDGRTRAESRRMEESSGDNSEVVGRRGGKDGHETLRSDKKEKGDRTSHGDSKRQC
jgi:hypothetical protein